MDESVPAHRDGPMSSSRESAQSREEKWYRASTVFILTSRRTQNCDICMKTKITRASCIRRTGTAAPRTENFGDLTTADHKILSEGWPGGWCSQGMSRTGGGGPAMVPNLRVCKHFYFMGWHTQGEKDELNVLPWYRPVGVEKTSSETQRRKSRAARKAKWSPRGTGTDRPHLSWNAPR